MHVELPIRGGKVEPRMGDGGLTRADAHRKVLELLEHVAELRNPAWPRFESEVLGPWRRGAADDTVMAFPFIWTIYEYPEGEDPRKAAVVWLEDLAVTMRAAGTDIEVEKFPDHPGTERTE